MKTTLLLTVALLFGIQSSNAQWNKTNLGGGAAITEHNGKLFSIASGINVSTDNGDSWTALTTDTLYGRMDFLASAGERLYVATYDNTSGEGTIYYSIDEGNSWVYDTIGMPVNYNFFTKKYTRGDVRSMYAYGDGELISAIGGRYVYKKNIADTAWVASPYFERGAPDLYAFNGNSIVAETDGVIYLSTDNAETFTVINQPGSGLYGYFVSHDLHWGSDGVIYLPVNDVTAGQTKLYRSSNLGQTWDSIPVASYIGKDFTQQRQIITTVYAKNNEIFFALNGSANNAPANIYYSNNGGDSFVLDTLGLDYAQFFTEAVVDFVEVDNRLFSVNNFTDTYHKELGSSVGIKNHNEANITVYPNPSNGIVHFSKHIQALTVMSLDGQILRTEQNIDALNLTTWPKGLYILKGIAENEPFTKTISLQ